MNQPPFNLTRTSPLSPTTRWGQPRRATFCITFFLFLIIATTGSLLAAMPDVSLAEYEALIDAATESLAADPTRATLHELQQELATIGQVTLPNGQSLTLQPLLGVDAESAPTVAEAQQRLHVVATQLMEAKSDDTTARLARLAAIFEDPAFVEQESLWTRLWRWLRSWLPEQSATEERAPSWLALAGRVMGYLLIAGGTLLLIYLLSLWLQNLLGDFIGGVTSKRRLTPDGELLNATEARQQAHQLAKSGSFREAVRSLYLSALLTLDERDLLHYDQSNTNREVLATIRDRPALYQRLQPVVEIFDEVWYGVHEPDQATFDRYVKAVEQLDGSWLDATTEARLSPAVIAGVPPTKERERGAR